MYVTIGDLRPMHDGACVFFGGCNWRCPYCFEKDILDKVLCEKKKNCRVVRIDELVGVIVKSNPKLVKISGGEPTEQERELEMLCQYLKSQNIGVQVHTNGSHPEVIGDLLLKGLIDWVTLDIKAPLDNERLYGKMTGGKGDPQAVRETLDIARDKARVFEVVYPVVTGENDKALYVKSVASDIFYCSIFTLHAFEKRRPILDQKWYDEKEVPTHEKMLELGKTARDSLNNVESVRIISHKGEEEI